MTSADLYEWVQLHGCYIEPLAEHKANVLQVTNPNNGTKSYLYLPIDKPIKDFTVYKVCNDLGIPIPDHASYIKPLHDEIKNKHVIPKRKKL